MYVSILVLPRCGSLEYISSAVSFFLLLLLLSDGMNGAIRGFGSCTECFSERF